MELLVQTRPHIGIVAGTADGASLCYRSLCHEAEHLIGRHVDPEITMHTFPLALYLDPIERDDWAGVATLTFPIGCKIGPSRSRAHHLPEQYDASSVRPCRVGSSLEPDTLSPPLRQR